MITQKVAVAGSLKLLPFMAGILRQQMSAQPCRA